MKSPKIPFVLGITLLGYFCLNTPLSAKEEPSSPKTNQEQSTSSRADEKKTTQTLKEEEKSAALDIREKELALERLKLTQKCSSSELTVKKESAQHKLTAAEEDLKLYHTKGRERSIAVAKQQLARAYDQYEYKKEELTQLKQMYTDDQLTDTSEEIILKRGTREMEDAKFEYDGKVITTRFDIEVKIPRQEQELKDAVASAQNELNHAIVEAQLVSQENTLALDKAKAALEKAQSAWENKKKELKDSH